MVSANNITVKIYVDSLFDKLFISRGYRKLNGNKKKKSGKRVNQNT